LNTDVFKTSKCVHGIYSSPKLFPPQTPLAISHPIIPDFEVHPKFWYKQTYLRIVQVLVQTGSRSNECSSGYWPVHILECCMWFASKKIETETKRDDYGELSRFFVCGEMNY